MDMRKFVESLSSDEFHQLRVLLLASDNPNPTPEEITMFRMGGMHKINAVKMLRNRCNVGLKDSLDILKRATGEPVNRSTRK